ncbi:MAG: hypothetical protein PHH54_01025 [Candidatus Nanoarchaeia archaeon]|nr:hypothetical protein [Candidatus Nanoarchaeia archaeon]MDD5740546.1 hypothetical protein [Candidatus Nanoarchaeia archaeon]
MKASEVKVDIEELKRFKAQNARERLKFIDFWAEYIKTHSDEDWSKQQNMLIDSQIESADSFALTQGKS